MKEFPQHPDFGPWIGELRIMLTPPAAAEPAPVAQPLRGKGAQISIGRGRYILPAWDKISAAEEQLVQVKAEIRALRNQARQAEPLEEQHRLQEDIRSAEKRKHSARREIDDIEDDIENQRDQLISSLESRLSQGQSELVHFDLKFEVRMGSSLGCTNHLTDCLTDN